MPSGPAAQCTLVQVCHGSPCYQMMPADRRQRAIQHSSGSRMHLTVTCPLDRLRQMTEITVLKPPEINPGHQRALHDPPTQPVSHPVLSPGGGVVLQLP